MTAVADPVRLRSCVSVARDAIEAAATDWKTVYVDFSR